MDIDESDLIIDYYRTQTRVDIQDTACRIIHQPTGIIVISENERGRFKNKKVALERLQKELEKLAFDLLQAKIDTEKESNNLK